MTSMSTRSVAALYGLRLDICPKDRLKSLPAILQRLLIQPDPIGNIHFPPGKMVVAMKFGGRVEVDNQSLRIES
jgi:hypothetical protein